MIEYKKIYRIFLVITLVTGGMYSIDNNYIYAQDKTIYQNELEADNQNKQKDSDATKNKANDKTTNEKTKQDEKNPNTRQDQINNQNIDAEDGDKKNKSMNEEQDISKQYEVYLKNLFDYRNKAIMDHNEEILKKIYDTDIKFGLWAYEHEMKKMQYLKNWSDKQGVVFDEIDAKVKVNKMREREKNLY